MFVATGTTSTLPRSIDPRFSLHFVYTKEILPSNSSFLSATGGSSGVRQELHSRDTLDICFCRWGVSMKLSLLSSSRSMRVMRAVSTEVWYVTATITHCDCQASAMSVYRATTSTCAPSCHHDYELEGRVGRDMPKCQDHAFVAVPRDIWSTLPSRAALADGTTAEERMHRLLVSFTESKASSRPDTAWTQE
jgi:hypothetical protein